MAEKLVTIASFSRGIEAHITKSRLEADGIECFIADENIVALNWLYSNVVGGVKLKIKESDAKRAIEILREGPISTDSLANKDNNKLLCPKCNSSDVYYERFSKRPTFIFWIILGFPLPFLKRKWKCKKCAYQWK